MAGNPTSLAVCDLYTICCVNKNSAKSNLIIYLFGETNCGKTTLMREGFGACVPYIKMLWEHGWCQSFLPNTAEVLGMDGFSQQTMQNGCSLAILEAIGDGSRVAIPQRYAQVQPETNGEVLVICSNHAPEGVFSVADMQNVMRSRLAIVQGSRTQNFYAATNWIRSVNGLPPLSFPPSPMRFDVRL